MNKSLKTETILLAGLFVSFFLPWIDLGFMSISGYEIPNRISNLISLANTFSDSSKTPPILMWAYIVYLIPLLSGLAIILNFNGKHTKDLSIGVGIFTLGLFVYSYLSLGKEFKNIFSVFSVGIYATLSFSVAIILFSILKKNNLKRLEVNRNKFQSIKLFSNKNFLYIGLVIFLVFIIIILSVKVFKSNEQTGIVGGKLSYPSEYIPALRIYLKNINNNNIITYDTKVDDGKYEIKNVPIGNYIAYTYPIEKELEIDKSGAGYTNAVPCGLHYGCDDHNLMIFEVTGGSILGNIDITDWYGAIIPVE